MLNPSSNQPRERLSLENLLELIHNRPLAFWGGLWATIVLVAAIAALLLINAGSIDREQPEPSSTAAPVVDELPSPVPASTAVPESQKPVQGFTRVAESSKEGELPLWLFGALGLSCATGTLLIYGSLRVLKQRRQPFKRVSTSLIPASTSAIRKKRQPPRRRRRASAPPSMSKSPVPRASVAAEPLVTVLPPEESHPLDWGEDSLADMMDIRKRQSLSSLLRHPER